MSSAMGAFVARYGWVFASFGFAAILLYGRARAAALVAAGRVSEDELSGFIRGAFLLWGCALLLFFVEQATAPAQDPLCLAQFPPTQAAGWVLWSVQGLLSFGLIYWMWVRGGDDLLARLAPAFTQGPVLARSFSQVRVRYFITAFVIVAPAANIVIQLVGPGFPMPECAAG